MPEEFLLTCEQFKVITFSIVMFWLGFHCVSSGFLFVSRAVHKYDVILNSIHEDIILLKDKISK